MKISTALVLLVGVSFAEALRKGRQNEEAADFELEERELYGSPVASPTAGCSCSVKGMDEEEETSPPAYSPVASPVSSPTSRRLNEHDDRELGDTPLNRGKCCNDSDCDEWAVVDPGGWKKLAPGQCVGGFWGPDCEGMTCGGGFYKVSGLTTGRCKTPGVDSWPYTNRRWTPAGIPSDPGAKSPSTVGPAGTGNNPPGGYGWCDRP